MKIENSQHADLPIIFELYSYAIALMKSKNQVYWPEFPEAMIYNEIEQNKQWKLSIDDQIACIWATTLNDELIWGNIDDKPSVYIHRIATHPDFRGRKLVKQVINWANDFGKKENLDFIRLDTVGFNKGLISHYEKLGFKFLGMKQLEKTIGLPEHYEKSGVCYFQKSIE